MPECKDFKMNGSSNDEQKAYEERLRRRLKILQQKLKEGKVFFKHDMGVEESLKAVRTSPDGQIDLDTVDGRVRSLALAVTAVNDREELKKELPLNEIQNSYFSFIEQNFGTFYEAMIKKNLTPHDVGMSLSRKKTTSEEITKNLDEFLEILTEFWEQSSDAAHAHIEDMHGKFKGVFGGDLFPSNEENIVSKCGIYVDTIILPDPFMRSKNLFRRWKLEDRAYYFIKHALNILQYKNLACANLDIPIVVVLPDRTALEAEEKEFFLKLGEADTLIHAHKVFNRKFNSFDELMMFAEELDTVERVVSEISDPTRVIFDTEWQGSISDQIERAMDDQHSQLLGTKNPGIIVASQGLGRMSVSNELLVKANRMRGIPIIDAPTSWKYFVMKLEYDAEQAKPSNYEDDLHVLRGLQNLAEGQMEWIGKIPEDALIELRRLGALNEIREILSSGIDQLVNIDQNNFIATSKKVFDNISEAFIKHKENISELNRKKWKFAGKDIGSWLVVGSMEVTAAATGLPVWGLSTLAASQLLDVPKLKDIPKSIKEFAEESNRIKRSPVGMLFKYSQVRA